jgi:2-phosphoglycerate kinase
MVGTEYPGAFVVQCIVAIGDENLHRSHFWVRDQATEGLRPLEKYLDALPQIREIQEYLIERARRHDVPVIVNESLDHAIGDVLDLVLRRADQLVAAS